MEADSDILVQELRVDGGPTKNKYLMQFQSDILNAKIQIPEAEELSGIGAACMAGIAVGLWDEEVLKKMHRNEFVPMMDVETRGRHIDGWKQAVDSVLK